MHFPRVSLVRMVRASVVAGVLLALVGAAGMAGLIPAIGEFTYPIVWWGLLLVIDALNRIKTGATLWNRHFWLIVMPASVIFWLVYEFLNLFAPQWRYTGGIRSLPAQILFGFAAFATVIPIMVECFRLVAGRR